MVTKPLKMSQLRPRQRQAALLAAQGASDADIASVVKVRRETVNRWRKLPQFVDAKNRIVDEALGEAERELKVSAKAAVVALSRGLDSENENVQIRAASALLKSVGAGAERMDRPTDPSPEAPRLTLDEAMATLISALCAARSMFSHDWLRQMSGDYRSSLEIIRNDIDYLLEPKEWEMVGEVVDPDEI